MRVLLILPFLKKDDKDGVMGLLIDKVIELLRHFLPIVYTTFQKVWPLPIKGGLIKVVK